MGRSRSSIAATAKGPLMLLLHGFPDHEGTFAAQVADLARDHLVVIPRLRGYSPSSIPSDVRSYALPKVAEDIAALIQYRTRQSHSRGT